MERQGGGVIKLVTLQAWLNMLNTCRQKKQKLLHQRIRNQWCQGDPIVCLKNSGALQLTAVARVIHAEKEEQI